MATSYLMTYEVLIRLGLIARSIWPRLTDNCRLVLAPYQPGVVHVAVYNDPALRIGLKDLTILPQNLQEYWMMQRDISDVTLRHFRGDIWPLLAEWYMGADEEYDILVVMPGGHA